MWQHLLAMVVPGAEHRTTFPFAKPQTAVTTAATRFPLRALALFVSLGAIGAALWTAAPACLFAATFHVPCPGCGSTRAARALAHLDVAGALRANPVAPLSIALLALLCARSVWLVYLDGTTRRLGDPRGGRALVLALLAAALLQVLVWALRFFGFFGGPVAV
jgi:hypothetical protein